MNAEVRIGTSGYSYADWKGRFYPPNLSPASFLEFYAGRFSCVEINYTYYRMPDRRTMDGMVERTPAGFLFTVKAFRGFTHEIDQSGMKASLRQFLEALEPMARSGRLGCVLFQFPSSFHYSDENRRYLGRLLSVASAVRTVVEFRGSDWFRESVYSGLRKAGTGMVCVDEPPLKGLPPASDIVTAETGYIRFHGRNSANWWTGDSASRYDYFYSDKELEEWVPRVEKMASSTDKTFIFMNNHWQGKAAENAAMLKAMLARKGIKAA